MSMWRIVTSIPNSLFQADKLPTNVEYVRTRLYATRIRILIQLGIQPPRSDKYRSNYIIYYVTELGWIGVYFYSNSMPLTLRDVPLPSSPFKCIRKTY